MNTYRITSAAGQELGCYAAETESLAIHAMSVAAGYESIEAAAKAAGPFVGTVLEICLYNEANDCVTPEQLNVTHEEYAEACSESYAAGDEGWIRVKGHRVYAA